MSLLCQLYSLYESIQEYKGACQADSNADCTYAMENAASSFVLGGLFTQFNFFLLKLILTFPYTKLTSCTCDSECYQQFFFLLI
uniref:Protein FAM89A n=1 Tax=Anas platyrhynchos platyrhynchos TaxID=8840 RepID=U3I005_ANAPP